MELFDMHVARAKLSTGGDLAAQPSACRVCGGSVEFSLTGREMMFGTRESFDYFECEQCGCLQIGAIPGDLDPYYPATYYANQYLRTVRGLGPRMGLGRRWTELRLSDGILARAISGRRYARFDWFRRTQTKLADEILDVGCGSGRLLGRLDRAGFERLTGIDPIATFHDEAPGGTGPGPRFQRVSLRDHQGRYRLVMAHHSFEHLADPIGAFAAFARLVEPTGYLLLRLPLADSWARRKYGADWVQLDAPRHLHLHTRHSLEILAQRSGFRIVHVVDDSGPFQIWGSEVYRRGVSLADAGRGGRDVLNPIERLRARFRARKLARSGAGDQACFYLQRIE